jgi:hypothetical protein
MRVFLKPYVREKAQSAGMETYISSQMKWPNAYSNKEIWIC